MKYSHKVYGSGLKLDFLDCIYIYTYIGILYIQGEHLIWLELDTTQLAQLEEMHH